MSQLQLSLYAQLKKHIVDQILQEAWQPDSRIPSQRILSQQHNMSHMTVRRALNELMSEGVLYAIPGKGMYVSGQDKQIAESGLFVSFTEDMASRGLVARNQVLRAELVDASTSLAQIFEVEVGTQLVLLRRLRFADAEPMVIQDAFLLHQRMPGLLAYDFSRLSLYQVMHEAYSIAFGSATSSVEATIADRAQADLLDLTAPTALLITEQITRATDGCVVEFVRSVYRGDRYKMSLHADERQTHTASGRA